MTLGVALPAWERQDRQLCVLQLHAEGLFLSLSFSPKPGINILGVKVGGGAVREEEPQGTEACNGQSGSDLQTEPSRLIQHKVAAEEILPSQ